MLALVKQEFFFFWRKLWTTLWWLFRIRFGCLISLYDQNMDLVPRGCNHLRPSNFPDLTVIYDDVSPCETRTLLRKLLATSGRTHLLVYTIESTRFSTMQCRGSCVWRILEGIVDCFRFAGLRSTVPGRCVWNHATSRQSKVAHQRQNWTRWKPDVGLAEIHLQSHDRRAALYPCHRNPIPRQTGNQNKWINSRVLPNNDPKWGVSVEAETLEDRGKFAAS